MEAIAYVQVSSKAQDHKTQRAELERAAQARGDTIVRWYAEKMTGAALARPSLDQLRKDARAGKVRRVYVYKLDRLTRSGIRDTLEVVEELRKAGAELVTVADGFTLDGPAGSGGARVSLVSSDPILSVPATVTVPQNSSSATVPLTAPSVISTHNVVLTATRGSESRTARLTVGPLLTFTPSTVFGGDVSNGVLQLPGRNFLRTVVTLTSSNPAAASVPPTVIAFPGATAVGFPVTTHAVTGPTPVTIIARQGKTVVTGVLTVLRRTGKG